MVASRKDPMAARREPLRGEAPPWHAMSATKVLEAFSVDGSAGLSAEEAALRLATDGANELRGAERPAPARIFLRQFNDAMIWVLLGALALSALQGQVVEAVAIAAVLLLNAVLGFVQEYQAEQAMDALRAMAAPVATVVRSGAEIDVPASELVTGDIVLLESGDRVPADGRLLDVSALRVEESSLTGESHASAKQVEPVAAGPLALGDRNDMVFAGTSVAVGHARFVVTATGAGTEMGRVAELLAAVQEDRTPLQEELSRIGTRLAIAVLAIAAVVFATGVAEAQLRLGGSFLANLANQDFRSVVTTQALVAISLAVAAIPEGLPAVVTLTLSIGVKAMAARNAIIRHLHAVETLGSTTFIATDKTGTLTRNEMRVTRVQVGIDAVSVLPDWALVPTDEEPLPADLDLLLEVAANANDAHYDLEGRLLGDPTETALVEAADRLGTRHMRPARLAEIPFDSARKRMTTAHRSGGRLVAYTKGGADVVLELCESALVRGRVVPLTEALRISFAADNDALAGAGYRTLAFAMRDLGEDDSALADPADLERGLTFLGIAGLVDPPRAEVRHAIAVAHHAGIQVAMVTGDHALTARAVADDIGLLEGDRVVTGVEMQAMSDAELDEQVEGIRVYARVDPEHKLRIVEALKRRGHVVAMTGDGVNDAPALKRADIGVAMGRVGTDVARDAADMVLADDDFATIVEAVRQGRVVYDNIKKTVLFLLSCNISEVLIVFIPTFFVAGPALLPLQLLWNNLITDGAPALALGVDPPDRGLMDRAPRSANDDIVTRANQVQIVWQGGVLTAAGLAVFAWGDIGGGPSHNLEVARTMLFTTMMLGQLLHSLNFRVPDGTIWSRAALANRWLLAAIALPLAAQVAILYAPPLQRVFGTVALGPEQWAIVVVGAIIPVAIIDAVKVILARARRSSKVTAGKWRKRR